MKRITIAALFAASCLFAADEPKPLSHDFAKAGLKALIALRNSWDFEAPQGSKALAISAMTDAEVASSNANDKEALDLLRLFRVTGELNEKMDTFDEHKIRRGETVNENAMVARIHRLKACSGGIEKMLRSETLVRVPECYEPANSLSAAFTNSALKVLVALRGTQQSRIDSAVDDARIAASTEGDKHALTSINGFRAEIDTFNKNYSNRQKDLENEYSGRKNSKHRTAEIDAALSKDPETFRAASTLQACSNALEKMLNSGTFAPTPECGPQQ